MGRRSTSTDPSPRCARPDPRPPLRPGETGHSNDPPDSSWSTTTTASAPRMASCSPGRSTSPTQGHPTVRRADPDVKQTQQCQADRYGDTMQRSARSRRTGPSNRTSHGGPRPPITSAGACSFGQAISALYNRKSVRSRGTITRSDSLEDRVTTLPVFSSLGRPDHRIVGEESAGTLTALTPHSSHGRPLAVTSSLPSPSAHWPRGRAPGPPQLFAMTRQFAQGVH